MEILSGSRLHVNKEREENTVRINVNTGSPDCGSLDRDVQLARCQAYAIEPNLMVASYQAVISTGGLLGNTAISEDDTAIGVDNSIRTARTTLRTKDIRFRPNHWDTHLRSNWRLRNRVIGTWG